METLWTIDTKEAAAFATLGARVEVISDINTKTSQRVVRFLVDALSAGGEFSIKQLRPQMRNGTLEKTQPGHPVLTILRAYRNHGRLLDMAHRGERFDLRQVPGTATFQLESGSAGLPGVKSGDAVVRTTDSQVAAALLTVGLPLLQIEHGGGSNYRFTLAGFDLRAPGIDGAQLVQAWRADMESVPWELPFAQAIRGLRTKAILTAEVKRAVNVLLIHKPGTRKHAVIREDATDAAWDIVKRHLGGV